MQTINLIREFEMQKMKDSETIKENFDKLLNIANKVRLLGTNFPDALLVKKNSLLSVKDTSLRWKLRKTQRIYKKFLWKRELLQALQAQEQQRLMRPEIMVEGASSASLQHHKKFNNKKHLRVMKALKINKEKENIQRRIFHLVSTA